MNIVGSSFLRVLQEKRRADERTRTAYPCSLRVITQGLQSSAGDCKCRIFRGVTFLRLAECCTVLRSRWCQSGVRRLQTLNRGLRVMGGYGAWKVTGRLSKLATVLFRCLSGSSTSSLVSTLRASVPSTASPSMRATGMPTQPWIPSPKARCPDALRLMSQASGSSQRRGSRLAAPKNIIACWSSAISTSYIGVLRRSAGEDLHRGLQADGLLERRPGERRVGAQQFPLIWVGGEQVHRVAQGAHRANLSSSQSIADARVPISRSMLSPQPHSRLYSCDMSNI